MARTALLLSDIVNPIFFPFPTRRPARGAVSHGRLPFTEVGNVNFKPFRRELHPSPQYLGNVKGERDSTAPG